MKVLDNLSTRQVGNEFNTLDIRWGGWIGMRSWMFETVRKLDQLFLQEFPNACGIISWRMEIDGIHDRSGRSWTARRMLRTVSGIVRHLNIAIGSVIRFNHFWSRVRIHSQWIIMTHAFSEVR